MIRLRRAQVTFTKPEGGTRTVLHDIDLDVTPGQFVALVGRSGCGKTTLLNMIAALVEPSSGKIEVHGTSPREARPHLGFMLARDALLPWRSAQGNVEYGLELRGVDRATRRRVAHDWLSRVHLGGSERLWPWQLSQGMRQRVALARTWALDPDVLLMDEPFAALDARTRIAVQQEFLELWQSGPQRTVVFVTHDLGEAIALADRVVLLGEGRILDDVEVGIERPRDLESVAAHPRYQELYERFRKSL
ncbi:ABC transporter ATP-binding protein [Rhodococcus aetherivorans]|nr:ABC transporter ATP-binding protein [Rhodococcus aetherivorans]